MALKPGPSPEQDYHTMTFAPVVPLVNASNDSPASPPADTSTTNGNREGGSAALNALSERFNQVSDLDVLIHCMGGTRVSDIPKIANDIADHIIVICLDCEHWSSNTEEPTEVGIATFSRRDMFRLVAQGDYGDHGEHLLQQVKFYLLRLIETAHLPCMQIGSRGVNGNRFGQGRFVTFAEARQIMKNLFIQPIPGVYGVKGSHPIVVLGQDIGHDRDNLRDKPTAFDIDGIGTVVRYIDTQVLARDRKYWVANSNQIGLRNLVSALWFEHSDAHTAANDAARTLISAFQIALGGHECKIFPTKTMMEVATSVEQYSVANFTPIGGVKEYCWKCGNAGHMNAACQATGLFCDECTRNQCTINPGEEHITAHCLCVAEAKAKARRERDAQNRAARRAPAKNTPTRGSLHTSPSTRGNSTKKIQNTWGNKAMNGGNGAASFSMTLLSPGNEASYQAEPPAGFHRPFIQPSLAPGYNGPYGGVPQPQPPPQSHGPTQHMVLAPRNHNQQQSNPPEPSGPRNGNELNGHRGNPSRRGRNRRGRGNHSQPPSGDNSQTG